MAFAALNSGLWLAQEIRHGWTHLEWFTGTWLFLLIFHLAFVIIRKPAPLEDSFKEE